MGSRERYRTYGMYQLAQTSDGDVRRARLQRGYSEAFCRWTRHGVGHRPVQSMRRRPEVSGNRCVRPPGSVRVRHRDERAGTPHGGSLTSARRTLLGPYPRDSLGGPLQLARSDRHRLARCNDTFEDDWVGRACSHDCTNDAIDAKRIG